MRTTVGGRTWISFDTGLLGDLGVEVRDVEATATDVRGRLGFAARAGGVKFWLRGGAFEDLVSGTVTYDGGFSLLAGRQTISLAGFALRPGTGTRVFELLGANGEVIFTADHMHVLLDRESSGISMFNLDLRISQRLAKRIDRPELTGLAIGTLAVEADYDALVALTPRGVTCTTPNWLQPEVEVDVALIDIGSVQQSGAAMNGAVVMTPSATLKNVGTSDVAWQEKFSGPQEPYGVAQHPFLVWALFRVANGEIEQIGRSSVKHAFFTINSSCSCFGGSILWSADNAGGSGCEDTYSVSTNNDTFNLGPRDEIEAHAGTFEECGSHFDPACTGLQTHETGHDPFEHKMSVLEADLATPNANYLFQAWYIVRDDIDIFNTMGWRKLTPTGPNFPLETNLVAGPALDAWVDPVSPPAGAANATLDVGDGHLQLAVRTANIGGGNWRYTYALMNHDFDRQVESFTLPLPPGANVSLVQFGDLDDLVGNDWQPGLSPDAVTWQAPVGNALDWGTMFNFVIETDSAPVASAAELTALEGGGGAPLRIDTLAPHATQDVLCEVTTDKSTYTTGEQITLSSLRYANPTGAPHPARLRLQLSFDAFFTADLVDLGAGGGFALPSGANLQLGPLPLLVVQPTMPRGSWAFRCALEDPTAGDVQAEDFAPMTFE